MARRARADELEERSVPLPKPPTRDGHHDTMIAVGRTHELHAVGPILGATGARASLCRIVGSFYDPPPGPEFPRCPACFPAVRR